MIISAYFTDSGAPKTGLSPTVTVYDLSDNTKDVDAASMTEVGGGFYKYDWSGFDSSGDYTIICDGGSGLSNSEDQAVALMYIVFVPDRCCCIFHTDIRIHVLRRKRVLLLPG